MPKTSKFPVWNDFQFCLTVRQADRVKQLPYSDMHMHAQDEIPFNLPNSKPKYCATKLQVGFPIHVMIHVLQNSKYNIQLKLSCSSIID